MPEHRVDFQLAFEALPGSFLLLAPDPPHYTILGVSEGMLRRSGRQRHDVVGKGVFEVFPENPAARSANGPASLRSSLQAAIDTRQPSQMPLVRYDIPDGRGNFQVRYWLANNKPVLSASGEVLFLLHSTAEVTEAVVTRQKMQESEERFRTLVEQAPVAIALTRGPDLIFESINASMLPLIGKEHAGEVIGQALAEAVPELEEQPVLDLIRRVYQTGQPFQGLEIPVRLRAGDQTGPGYYNVSYTPLRENGQITGVIHLAVEVTEQVLARNAVEESQAALRTSEERFRMVADNISQLVWMADEAGWIFWYNQRWYEYTATTLEEMQGWGWQKVHHPDHLERVVATAKRAWQGSEPWEVEFPLRRHDGQYGWFLTRVVPVRDAEGNIVYWFGTNTDITGQQQAQQQLQALNQELAAANEELRAANEEQAEANRQLSRVNADLDTFVYTASHDLKAPILNIEGLLKALEKQLTPQARQNPNIGQIYAFLYKSVDRFKTTIGDLTEVARISKESQEDVYAIPPEEVLQEVLSDLESQIREAGAQVEVKLDCRAVHFSRKNLKSVLYNLLSNALKYRAPDRKPLIKISWWEAENGQFLTVGDNGLGMDMQQEAKIFALFKRLHNHVEGTGIGLYIVKKMVEDAGGRIGVESQVGVGSTFRVYFKR